MKSPVKSSPDTGLHFTRRELIEGGLLLGAISMLTGCQPARSQGVVSLPKDVWPDPTAPVVAKPVSAPPREPGVTQTILTRAQWTRAKPNFRVSKPMNGITRITVHHSALNSTGILGKSEVARMLENIRRSHVSRVDAATGAHWVDIGYHYIIDPAGRVWEGRPTHIEGAHVSKTNDHNLGVMLLGNFNEHRPTNAALATLDNFVAAQMRRHKVPASRVYTHQELKPTECPGTNLQQYMKLTRLSSGRMYQQWKA
ncbi:MAG TPA: peptidoglycan recognition family protein [Phycisphaerales bacterium]|nr:peptidoglycan recognition family protein [Phycisphaerales bacterium]